MSIVSDLKKKYGNKVQNDIYPRFPTDFNPTVYLFHKYAYKVPKGWYGFDLDGAPFSWALVIDDFLEWLEKESPFFEIHQIKIKFGGLRFHIGHNTALTPKELGKIDKQITVLEDWLTDGRLVY